jgi:anthranilate phosphoribosyltransferase
MFRELLGRLAARKELSTEELSEFIASIARDELSDSQLSAFLMALLLKGVTQPEVTAIARAMREHTIVLKPRLTEDMLDTCGTGGGQSTFNISTATAILCAASGIPVAKHGSRSLSSLCGSIDVAEALGIAVDLPADAIEHMIEQVGIAFIHAPLFHPIMRRILPVEASLGIKTIFYTLIGPLINPAKAKRHLLGVYQPELLDLTVAVAKDLNFSKAMVVHGADYLDEISLLGPTQIRYLQQGLISSFQITPEQFGLSRCSLKDIRSQPPQASAEQLRQLFNGQLQGPIRDAVLLNSAGALMVGGRANDFAEGIALARHLLDESLVGQKLEQLVTMSRDLSSATVAAALQAKPVKFTPVETPQATLNQTTKPVSAASTSGKAAPPSAERLWHGALAATPDGVVVLDGVGRVQTCNPAAAAQLGVDMTQILGQPYSILLPEKVRELRQHLVSVQNGAQIARWEDCLNEQYFAMLAISINDGESILLISRDISEQKRLE